MGTGFMTTILKVLGGKVTLQSSEFTLTVYILCCAVIGVCQRDTV